MLDNNDRYPGGCSQHVPNISFSHPHLCRGSRISILIVALLENESRLSCLISLFDFLLSFSNLTSNTIFAGTRQESRGWFGASQRIQPQRVYEEPRQRGFFGRLMR